VNSGNGGLHGVMAEFLSPGALEQAIVAARREGYTRMDAYTPYPVEGLPELLGRRRSRLPLVFLLAGLIGGGGGYFMQWYAMRVSYPINVGGRPLHSWPAFIPVTFELTILIAALTGVAALFIMMRLPRLNHPVFAVKGFERVTVDRFYLCIERSDPRFSGTGTRRFLEAFSPVQIFDVPKEVAT